MIIHIFTGSKGGIGKTRCAICSALYYILGGSDKPLLEIEFNSKKPKERKVNIYDANSNNIDFFTIMTGKDYQILSEGRNEYKAKYIRQEFTALNYKKKKLEIEGYAYIRNIPFDIFNGISDFWSSVYGVAELTIENDKRNVLIVDTNLSVPTAVFSCMKMCNRNA